MITPYIRLSYGELLHLYRTRNHFSLKHVAEQLGVTPGTIKNYESDRTLPSYQKMKKLEKLYGKEFKNLSEFLMSGKKRRHKNEQSIWTIKLNSPQVYYHGCMSEIKRRKINFSLQVYNGTQKLTVC